MQSSVRCSWSLWNSQYLVSSLFAGLTSCGMATLGTFHVSLRVGPATLRSSEGCIAEVNTVAAAQAEVVLYDPYIPSSCRGPLSAFFAPPWGSILVCLSLGASFSFFVAPALFLLSRRASFLGEEGFFAVDILLYFSKDLGHAGLRVL